MTTTQQKIDSILAAAADTETRICRRVEIGRVAAHQGDVYVHCVADNHPRGDKPWGSTQVAVGTTQGSRHVAEGPVQVISGSMDGAAKVMPKFNDQQRQACLGPVVVATGPWTLTHPEHSHHQLPAGTYQVTYQLDMATAQRVAD